MVRAAEAEGEDVVLGEGTVEADLGSSREASRTDSEVSLASCKVPVPCTPVSRSRGLGRKSVIKSASICRLIRFGFPFRCQLGKGELN